MSASSGACRGVGASGISALRPLPRAGRFSIAITSDAKTAKVSWRSSCGWRSGAFQHFAGKRDVRLGAARFDVVEHHRHAVAGRFAEADVARNHGSIHLVLEKFPHVPRDLVSEVGAL